MLSILRNILGLFYPFSCVVCQENLIKDEKYICLHCILKLPKTNYHLQASNIALDRLENKIPCQKASAYLYYSKDGDTSKIIQSIKYKENTRLAYWMGDYMGRDMIKSDFFEHIDFLVPIPLHESKFKKRGFNQAEEICKGLAMATGIPIESECLFRKIANPTQTKKDSFERWINTRGIFEVRNKTMYRNKHILLFDDVLTTGATLEAAVIALKQVPGIKISVLSLAISS
ncbi:DNA catabolic protein [Bacteroidales bacterium]|nr:DNA catabolic protein [Bacteroidales bacterium]